MTGRLTRLATLLCAAVALWACSEGRSVPTRYYVLAPTLTAAPPGSRPAAQGPFVELTRVILPEYLNNSSILTRSKTNDVQRAEYDLWAGPLADEITRTLGENLSLAVPTDRLFYGGTRRASPADFGVEVEIVAFERDDTSTVRLVARWSVLKDDAAKPLAMRRSVYEDSAGGSDYGSTVAAMSRVLGQLSAEIADAIRKG
jgi:uncharacterized lipoprotein YmbA